jgi:hypothetical protein
MRWILCAVETATHTTVDLTTAAAEAVAVAVQHAGCALPLSLSLSLSSIQLSENPDFILLDPSALCSKELILRLANYRSMASVIDVQYRPVLFRVIVNPLTPPLAYCRPKNIISHRSLKVLENYMSRVMRF